MNRESSIRLSLLRFPLILGVVFIHNYSTRVAFSNQVIGAVQDPFAVNFVKNLISQGFARVSVPLFFLMSGYLFFEGSPWSSRTYLLKLKARVKSLLVPFLFWNFLVLGLIALFEHIPETRPFFSGEYKPVAAYTPYDYLASIFGFLKNPIAYQFWFIRDLMLMVLLAPPLHYLNKHIPFPFLAAVFAFWFVNFWPIYAPSSECVLFFSAGAYVGSRGKSLFGTDRFGAFFIAVYLPIVLAGTMLGQSGTGLYLQKAGIILGVMTALFLTKRVASSQAFRPRLLSLTGG